MTEPNQSVTEKVRVALHATEAETSSAEENLELSALRSSAEQFARTLAWVPRQRESYALRDRSEAVVRALKPRLDAIEKSEFEPSEREQEPEDFRALKENLFLLKGELQELQSAFREPTNLPNIHAEDGSLVPRIAPVAKDYLRSTQFRFSEEGFSQYVQAFQKVATLNVAELWGLVPALKLALLEEITERTIKFLERPANSYDLSVPVLSLVNIRQTSWKQVIEPLILFDEVLRQDPAGAYGRMDYDSRDLYRRKLVNIANHSDCSEMEVAREVLALAKDAQKHSHEDARVAERYSHVGAYLLGEDVDLLATRVGFRPPFGERMRMWLQRHPDDFYLPGIAALTFAIVLAVVFTLTSPATSLEYVMLATLVVLLPSSQSAVQIMNYLATLFLPAQILPKLDFSEGIPADCVTLVAIPTMLLNEKQVRRMVDQLEVRFLGNQDPNLHFALLTDLQDSPFKPEEKSPLVDLCAELVQQLERKYAAEKMGSFYMFHRHRVYNPRERLWMGWERKRGKLMDLNNLLRAQFDSFPVKIGDLSRLPSMRFVITLDADTELPRGSARRMVGALAHPLNQAIIDPEKRVVVAGYGILQPRVGVSVQSTARSRLANIYSGQTGFDIYTHATSDVYQELYGEGIFVGKGIYEVDTLQRVLERRFPRNALLSHDLIEGAYARAGLASDIDVIEDYPSHYSAHNRRKHRWLRGDWQITAWLFPKVPDETGHSVPNPLSVVSRWKIFDNLRRSLVEPAFFIFLILGWTVLPGRPWAWTLAAVTILFLPALFQLVVDVTRALTELKPAMFGDAINSFLNAAVADWLTVTFLAHQALLSLDAVVRTMVRRMVTRQRLLQWETAAEAELAGHKRTMLDIYLTLTPAVAFVVLILAWFRRGAIEAALPILVLWAISDPISRWLNRPSRGPRKELSEKDRLLLRLTALRTWRYFAEFSTEEHHWLIPDNVREENMVVAPRISPTNLGLLLNARQVACEFGYLTLPEFAQLTLRTLETFSQLPKHRGHIFNWYDTKSLAPLTPEFISSVDNGNLLASLWSLQQGAEQWLDRPMLQPSLQEGFVDFLFGLTSLRVLSYRKFSAMKRTLRRGDWLAYLLDVPETALQDIHKPVARKKTSGDALWFQGQAEERMRQIGRTVQLYAPWLLPEFAGLRKEIEAVRPGGSLLPLRQMPAFIDRLMARLQSAVDSSELGGTADRCRDLLALLPGARARVAALIDDIKKIAEQSATFADEMDFKFLVNANRELLSIGFNVPRKKLEPACYDLLASEARIAYFVAIAKDDIEQESWFQLGRPPALDGGIAGLLSWTGTMFEYLMPALWMHIYPNSLLERAASAAVQAQENYAASQRIPWGISESACFKTDDAGNFEYHAFGVPALAIHKVDTDGPVVSPYSTFLALDIDPSAALQNLRKLQRKRAVGVYGFYDAVDFNSERCRTKFRGCEPVRCWMAHHQGMSLLALANFLDDEVVQSWFHSHPRVQATELLLQEKPMSNLRPRRSRSKAA